MPPSSPVFAARDLTKVYHMGEVHVQALRGVSLDLHEAEFLVLLGPSGSGKSTLLNMLGGLDVPTSGRVLYRGDDLTAADERALTMYRRRHVGFVFQFYNLIPSLTARENVALATDIVARPIALGYTNGELAWHYTKLSLVIGATGALAGTIFGAWLGSAMTSLYNEFFRFPVLTYRLPASVVLGGVAREAWQTIGDGYRVEVRVVVWREEDVVKVPTSSLFRHDGDWAVYRVEDGRAVRQRVDIGHRNGLEAQVLDGISPGDRIVVYPSEAIADGTLVVSRS